MQLHGWRRRRFLLLLFDHWLRLGLGLRSRNHRFLGLFAFLGLFWGRWRRLDWRGFGVLALLKMQHHRLLSSIATCLASRFASRLSSRLASSLGLLLALLLLQLLLLDRLKRNVIFITRVGVAALVALNIQWWLRWATKDIA
jgi:hypothetical protein